MNIWIPKTHILEPRDELNVTSSKVAGRFFIEGVLPDGRRRVVADWQKNLVTDAGLNRFGTVAPISYCSVGAGNTTPTVLDTALVNYVAHTTASMTSFGAQTSVPWYGYAVFTCTFSPPGGNKNISEIGLGWSTGGTNLWSRALIKDAGGSPTTITWLAAETLIVTYECRNYPFLDDIHFSTNISGIDYTGVMRCSAVSNGSYWKFFNSFYRMNITPAVVTTAPYAYSSTISAITTWPSGTSAAGSWSDLPSYVNNSLKRTGTGVWGPTLANYAGGIQSVAIFPSNGAYQMSFSPAIMKTSSDTLALTFSSLVWGRST
jgi:hypothetical protein